MEEKELVRGCGDLSFSPDGKVLAAAIDTSWGVLRWNVAEQTGHQRLPRAHGIDRAHGPIRSVAFSPDGKIFAKAYQRISHVDTKSVETGKDLFLHRFARNSLWTWLSVPLCVSVFPTLRSHERNTEAQRTRRKARFPLSVVFSARAQLL